MVTESTGGDVVFVSSVMDPRDFLVREVHGREALSTPFEYDLLVESTGGPLEADQQDALMKGECFLAFGTHFAHPVYGVVRRIESVGAVDEGSECYRLWMVPRIWDLSRIRGSWVYQNASPAEIIRDVLREAGLTEDVDFGFALSGRYPTLEYVVQYEESDLAFISRLAEHHGIFYFMVPGDGRSTVVFADANTVFTPLEGHEVIPFDPRSGGAHDRSPMTTLSRVQTALPRQVVLKDYNYRTPTVPLVVPFAVDTATGVGNDIRYGDHFKTPDEGRTLAHVRAEELQSTRVTYRGATRVQGLHCGHRFTLENHPQQAMDQDYVVTAATHHVRQARSADASGGAPPEAYRNEVTLLAYTVTYRPPRVTPRPRIDGVVHGVIDAATDDGVTAPVDSLGRYKVVLPWDVIGQPGGKASRWIRMAQPASGPDYGMHFPLHPGTEVLVAHIQGDPDRPVIIASAPNAQTQSPVTAHNATQSAFRTRNGITMLFDDAEGEAHDDDG